MESPFYVKDLTKEQRLEGVLHQNDARINYLAAIIKAVNQSWEVAPEVIRSQIDYQGFHYTAKVGLDTIDNPPPQPNYQNYYLIVDTGSSFIWTQCENSKTTATMANAHSAGYLGGPSTEGVLGSDRFTFESGDENGVTESVYGLVCGCGIKQFNFNFLGNPSKVAGMIGMEPGPEALISQLDARFPEWQQIFTTPLLASPNPFYYMNLLGISVNRMQLEIPPGDFSLSPDGRSRGCVLDSGSPLTSLPIGAYTKVKDAMVSYFQQKNLPIIDKPELPDQQAFLYLPDCMCLVFQAQDRYPNVPAIIGNYAQSDYRVLFDLRTSTVSFAEDEHCDYI
ncbi:hypothetical protein IFM89_001225 [Coptis chinensis]|uniref:Xylanase inhibitor C-terminal domain-containing protein n=1 Tax=Coptis chinensis TaxID=261450 RepID=A0A835H2I2_9MAGN|nr:hypothetical protein IFM89_001225 [Coptis chinensis]